MPPSASRVFGDLPLQGSCLLGLRLGIVGDLLLQGSDLGGLRPGSRVFRELFFQLADLFFNLRNLSLIARLGDLFLAVITA
ncbi:MAG: hypothetical protein NT155_03930 [Candidatus Staskawiczbacteria bacterium]|nr:hypothetical protein [Candidatus Staskawiczbacteria bacterium]